MHLEMTLHLPWAAGTSGIVKPFNQLRVRSNSNFNHVGVWFHLEGPIKSEKQTVIPYFSPHTTGAKDSLQQLMKSIISEWKLIQIVQK